MYIRMSWHLHLRSSNRESVSIAGSEATANTTTHLRRSYRIANSCNPHGTKEPTHRPRASASAVLRPAFYLRPRRKRSAMLCVRHQMLQRVETFNQADVRTLVCSTLCALRCAARPPPCDMTRL